MPTRCLVGAELSGSVDPQFFTAFVETVCSVVPNCLDVPLPDVGGQQLALQQARALLETHGAAGSDLEGPVLLGVLRGDADGLRALLHALDRYQDALRRVATAAQDMLG